LQPLIYLGEIFLNGLSAQVASHENVLCQ